MAPKKKRGRKTDKKGADKKPENKKQGQSERQPPYNLKDNFRILIKDRVPAQSRLFTKVVCC